MVVTEVAALCIQTAVDLIIAAVCTLHLYDSMLYSPLFEHMLDLFSDNIRLADLLIVDLDMSGKGRYPVTNGPYMDIMDIAHSRYFGNHLRQILSMKADRAEFQEYPEGFFYDTGTADR